MFTWAGASVVISAVYDPLTDSIRYITEPAHDDAEPEQGPALPAEAWHTKPFDPDVAHAATLALSRGA
jgi:hypothetical protein